MADLLLLDYQYKNVDTECKHLAKNYALLNTSGTGLGKTYDAMAVSKYFGLNMIAIGPVTLEHTWRTKTKEHGINLLRYISYQSLRGTNKSETLNHDLLVREETKNIVKMRATDAKKKEKKGETFDQSGLFKSSTTFVATKTFRNLLRQDRGLLLVFDEAHNLKNRTSQLQAAHALVKALICEESASRIMLLTATPGDKEYHTDSIVKMLGINLQDNLYEYDHHTNRYIPTGIISVYQYCRYLDPVETAKIISASLGVGSINNKNATKWVYQLYCNVIKDKMVFAMEAPHTNLKKKVFNGYFNMPEADKKKLQLHYYSLVKSLHYDGKNIEVNQDSLGNVTKCLIGMERAKTRTLIRLASDYLNDNVRNKCIIYCNYIATMDIITKSLADYNPLRLSGSTKKNERAEHIDLFQAHDCRCRLIIAHPQVGGVGISLDDTHGAFKRCQFISPSYHFISLDQTSGRTFRCATTRSDPTSYFIFCKDFKDETAILDCLSRKARVCRELMKQGEGRALYPGEYPFYEEESSNGKELNFEVEFIDKTENDDSLEKMFEEKLVIDGERQMDEDEDDIWIE